MNRCGILQNPSIFIGDDCVDDFLNKINPLQFKTSDFIKDTNYDYNLSEEEIKIHNNCNTCHICEKEILISTEKVIDHDHLTGHYRGAAHNDCNINYHLKYFKLPVIIHNAKNYDMHLIIEKIGKKIKEYEENSKTKKSNQKFDIIANNSEKYITMSWNRIKIIDSFQFMAVSLDSLSKNLNIKDKKNVLNFCKLNKYNDEQIELLMKKGVFPYDWFDSIENINAVSLPSKDEFYSKLNKKNISNDDYKLALKVWEKFKCQSFKDYHNLYLYINVLLLADVFENFRNVCFESYGLDPANYLTAPSLAWDAFLKKSQVKIELITDIEKYLMIEKGLHGGYSNIGSIRDAKSNNKYLHDFDNTLPTSFIMYEDMNNLYGWAMSQKLPLNDFNFIDVNLFDVDKILNYNDNSDKGFIFEVDLEYPKELHNAHNDLPLAPENINVKKNMLSNYQLEMIKNLKNEDIIINPNSKIKKLIYNLNDKQNYTCHIRNLKFYLQNGLKLKKIHKIL